MSKCLSNHFIRKPVNTVHQVIIEKTPDCMQCMFLIQTFVKKYYLPVTFPSLCIPAEFSGTKSKDWGVSRHQYLINMIKEQGHSLDCYSLRCGFRCTSLIHFWKCLLSHLGFALVKYKHFHSRLTQRVQWNMLEPPLELHYSLSTTKWK